MAYGNKEKERQNKKAYYRKNRKKILENKKKYYQKNKERILKKTRLSSKKWYQKNRKKILKQSQEYYQKNIERIQQQHRRYNQEHKKERLKYKVNWQKYKRKTDSRYRLDENMGTAISNSLKGKKAGRLWETLVGYTLEDLIEYLEKQFDHKMNWENYGGYWVVDHLKPRSLFNYISSNDLEFKQCWALKNLQPLEKIKNIKKRNHYIS
ncbi:MAG: hypothetical protein COU98_02185 [Candidatus Staskawiczbacteria bacterium CG10_big_fil_rev_8_21_14_0_10_38_10]|uniref:Uncharacterized protein n=1 Tax=Candidatus Staskawiczbacteria bacterium CG10_big_fil_rev_8_21_14_0_10_38_10 TaxID=1974891 RepID=A0A2H9T101_9BACT|nr:MAG: hypothetical protein COU98_02185 [Candidatus Staskawiczbacteria bacterium CG10_big_fil_rev_8_21_14_0_10_38_10]